jgi:multiple sugar transport system permease protein
MQKCVSIIKNNKKLIEILKHLTLITSCFIILAPVFWIISQSLKSYFDVIAYPPKIFAEIVFKNYIEVFNNKGFLKALQDSLIIALGSTSLGLFLGAPCAYAITRLRFKGSNQISFFMLSTRIMTPIIIIIPLNRLFQFMGLLDNYIGLILAHTFIILGITVWMLRGFIIEVPFSIEEAATIDGCSHFSVFFKIVLPIIAPGLAATAIFSFIFSWNELLMSMILGGSEIRTVPVFMSSEFIGFLSVNWGPMSACGILVAIPMIIFVIIVQRHLVKGIAGAVK